MKYRMQVLNGVIIEERNDGSNETGQDGGKTWMVGCIL